MTKKFYLISNFGFSKGHVIESQRKTKTKTKTNCKQDTPCGSFYCIICHQKEQHKGIKQGRVISHSETNIEKTEKLKLKTDIYNFIFL